MMSSMDQDFLKMAEPLDKKALLILADHAVSLAEMVLDSIKESEAGDAYEYDGPMGDIDCARDAISRYKGYLITGQK